VECFPILAAAIQSATLPSVTPKGPKFIRFFKPILEVLKHSGGSGTTAEVIDRAIELLKIPESEQETTLKNGQSRVRNQV
jgi:hypothetical protein